MRIFAGAEVDRPMDEVEVQVLQLELGEGVIERGFDGGRIMLGVPELGRDEDVFTLEAWDVLESTLDAFCDLLLVLVADWWKISLAYISRVRCGDRVYGWP